MSPSSSGNTSYHWELIRAVHFARSSNLEEGVMSQFFDFGHYVPQHLPAKAIHHQSHEHPTKLERLSIDALMR